MHFHVITSTACNSKCRYCYQKGFNDDCGGMSLNEKFSWDFSTPYKINYSVGKLKDFLLRSKDSSSHTVTFYGGEPLLQKSSIIKIIDDLSPLGVKFMIQTNGLLLDKLPSDYTNKFSRVLVSLDGSEE
ncbi:putative peptide-modifying radical SAM/SPASM domain-containing protein, partial [Candidatus Pacearchaeota archaeon CG10_big_fil_rev_8_21_14_0_10_35_13]